MMTEQLSLSCLGAAQPELLPSLLDHHVWSGAAQPELPIKVVKTRFIRVFTQ